MAIGRPKAGAAMAAPNEIALLCKQARGDLTQVEFSQLVGIPLATLRNWEAGYRAPSGGAHTLMTIMASPKLRSLILSFLKK
jgi:DNA-binding transcriptional regulator YiaG